MVVANFMKGNRMKASIFCIMFIITLLIINIPCKRCFAGSKSPDWFYSQHGFSIAIPEWWRQVPNEVVQKVFEAAISNDMLTANIESVIAIEFDENTLRYSYAVIQVMEYSESVNGLQPVALNKKQIEENFKVIAKSMRSLAINPTLEGIHGNLSENLRWILHQMKFGKLYLDTENMSFLIGLDSEVDSLDKIKQLMFVALGRYAYVNITYYCLKSDWQRFGSERDLILDSFQFDALSDYKEAPGNLISFWDDVLTRVFVFGSIFLYVLFIAFLGQKSTSKS